MRFSHATLAQTFFQLREDDQIKRFPLFAFVLATEADGEIFPNLMMHYSELHELTGSHMLVVAPTVTFGENLTAEENARRLREAAESPTFQQAKAKFLERQNKESVRVARLCGIDVDKLPCILIFESLDDPKDHLLWEIKNTSAEAIVNDFRKIIKEVQAARAAEDTNLLQSVEKLQESFGPGRLRRVFNENAVLIRSLLIELAIAYATK